MTIRNTGGVSTLAVIDGIRAVLPEIRHMLPAGVRIKPIFDQSMFVKAALNSVLMGGAMAAGAHGAHDPAVPGQLASHHHHPGGDPAVDHHRGAGDGRGRPDAQHHDARRLRARGRHPGGQRHGGDREHRAPRRAAGAAVGRDRVRCRRSRHADLPLDAVHLHRVRAGVPAARHGQIPVFAAVAVGDRVAARQSRAVLHHGAGAVHVPDARRAARRRRACRQRRRRCRRGGAHRRPRRCARTSADARTPGIRERLPALPRGVPQRRGLDAVAGAHHGAGIHRHHGDLAAAVPAARPRLFPRRRRRADAPARARAAGHAHREHAAVFRPGRGGDPRAGRQRPDQRDPRQHRAALQRHQHRAVAIRPPSGRWTARS